MEREKEKGKTRGEVAERAEGFALDMEAGYFRNCGVDVMAFDDIYPAGHQSGVSLIMHGHRAATNGDIRFEPTPGQWQPVPKQESRVLDEETQTIVTTLSYPDPDSHLQGFNPMIYPDFTFSYEVKVQAQKDSVVVTVDLEKEVPEIFAGKLSFNLELFPGTLFGKPWIMDGKQGIFPRQPNGPLLMRPTNAAHPGTVGREFQTTQVPDFEELEDFLQINELGVTADPEHLLGDGKTYNPIVADDLIGEPYAVGRRLTVRPEDADARFTIESEGALLKLYDGRMNHNNGWFVVSSEVPAGKTRQAIRWTITPHVRQDWFYAPVVQVSQVGYHPLEPKTAVIELDKRAHDRQDVVLYKILENGPVECVRRRAEEWGDFLRYRYLRYDFSELREEGLYQIGYGESRSAIFRVAPDIYERGVWQPVLEYFLPVQMCHMRVNEKYRVWHGHCHRDDARMAPVNHRHFDGYMQGKSTWTKYQPGDFVPGLNVGGWHDAGDFDLRVESQSYEAYILALAYEAFGVEYDATTIDQRRHLVEIHQPDGENDILQQVEHGVLAVVSGYRALGRPYRGIISNSLRQYVLLGDASVMTDGVPGDEDDRWVFTEDNPARELSTAAHLAACSKALRGFRDALADECLEIAGKLFADTKKEGRAAEAAIHAAAELYLAAGEAPYREFLLEHRTEIVSGMKNLGWIGARVVEAVGDEGFTTALREAAVPLGKEMEKESLETPYGIPYRPHIWGAGWRMEGLAFQYYYLRRAFPDIFGPELLFETLHFILGCHPGSNTASFASGVGARSMTVAYGANRADWSYIPGGVTSGTALIRPDFPELLEFPFLWQQAEYVLGGGSSHYLFLVLAVRELLQKKETEKE